MKNNIKENIEEWVVSKLPGLTFRPHQEDIIVSIIESVLNKCKNDDRVPDMIVEAPTGSGKSIISIVSAGVLADIYGLRSYILCSDLYLWKQYDDFIKKHKSLGFGTIKGQTGNYHCSVNGEDMRNAECRIAAINWADLFNSKKAEKCGFKCACKCEYVKERKKAVKAKVVMMTYQLFLYQFNRTESMSFKKPDVIFCDECHNVPSIVQDQCSPVIKRSDFASIAKIYEHFAKQDNDLFSESNSIVSRFNGKKDLLKKLNKSFDEMLKCENENSELTKVVYRYNDIIESFFGPCTEIEESLAEKYRQKRTLTKKERELYKNSSFYKNYMCFWHDFMTAVRDTKSKFVKCVSDDEETITFNCVREDIMCAKYLLGHSVARVFLSATVGNKESFEQNVGLNLTNEQSSVMKRVPSTFDFSKSPIYVLDRYKINYSNSAFVFEKLSLYVSELCKRHNDEKGIIQTASYKNAKTIYENSPDDVKRRMIIYSNSNERQEAINRHLKSKNTILVGPSVCEGVDLPESLCRFIIILKVPYQSLGNPFVQEKMKVFTKWYKSSASNLIIQGIGRGVRNEKDYCVTYILDGCFTALYAQTKDQYSEEIQKRIKIYK